MQLRDQGSVRMVTIRRPPPISCRPMQASPDSKERRAPPRHERLKSWVACHELVLAVYRASSTWPKCEQYGLTAQIRRAAYSAAANLAEGSAKRGPREFCRFLNMSLGSIAELTYILVLARELNYIKRQEWGELEALRDYAGRLTWGLYRSLRVVGEAGKRVRE
jgi:four helix bundle protein